MSLRFNRYSIFTTLFLGLFSLTALGHPGLTEVPVFGSNPGNLALFRYAPSSINKTENRPLVVVLHGCNQSAGAIARTSDWNKLADRYGFYIAYPEQQLVNNPSRCFNWFREKDYLGAGGEVGSIHQIILYMMKNFAIDSSQVFVYGVSAGAAISVAYIANHPKMVNAGAILAGSAYGMAENVASSLAVMLKPKKRHGADWENRIRSVVPDYTGTYPRLVVMHGLDDDVVDPENSRQLVKQWIALHDLDSIPSSVKPYANASALSRYAYSDRNGKEMLIHYEMDEFGHALPVFPGEGDDCGGNTGLFARDMGFFSTYWIARDFGIVLE